MGIGREVADAYIDVHGDLSSFRRDLGGADDAMRKAARENADEFSDAWAKRIDKDVKGKWGSILDGMYSEKQIDWDRMIGEFNPRSLDDARQKITQFLREMKNTTHFGKDEEGGLIDLGPKLDSKQFDIMIGRLHEVIGAMQKKAALEDDAAKREEDHKRTLIDLQQELITWQDREARIMRVRAEAMDEAIAQNKAWARTFEGISKNEAIKNLNEDFQKLSKAMTDGDIGKWGNRLEGDFQRMAQRVREVSAAMLEQRRISDADAQAMIDRVDAFIQGQNAQSKAMQDALDATNRAREAQDEYNKSLRGMAQAFHNADMETKFRQLAAAIESNDWSGMARGAKNMEELRNRTMETATEMHRLGRMSDQELAMVSRRVGEARVQFQQMRQEAGGFGTTLRNALTGASNIFSRLNNVTRGFREHLQGFAGMNVFGDMITKGLDFIHNLDRISVSLSKNTIMMSTMASVGASSFAGLVTIAADLGNIIGGLAVALPAFAVGAGIGIGVLVAAFKDMKTVLADLKPAFAELQNQISSSFWTEAAGPIRDMVKTLMPILTPKLKGTATALGGLVGKLATAFKDIPAEKINDMFDRMNGAVDILGNAMPPLVRAFTTLGDVGSKYFQRFSTWIVKLSDQFDNFIQNAAANGDLDKWINNMIEGFKDLGRVIDGALGIFNAINTAARNAGIGGLKSFADALQNIAKQMQKPEFQKTLTTYLEGARDLTQKLGQAIRDLGPAFVSFAPTAKEALGDVGDAVKKLIGFIGEIFTNPTFQRGVADFTEGLKKAVEALAPAIKPFGDSLGNALTLLGKIVVSVAEIATAFTVVLSPVLDSMSAKLGTLVEPLKNTALNFINEMKGPLEALDKNLIAPLVDGFNNKLLPAINGFIDAFGPFATKVIQDLGPSFKIIVDEVLPNFVNLAKELLTPLGGIITLLSPTLAATLTAIGDAFADMANDIKVLKGELPITELSIFKQFSPEEIDRQIRQESIKPEKWSEILAIFFTQNIGEGMGLAWTEKIYPAIVKADDWLWDQASKAIDMMANPEKAKTAEAAANRDWVAGLFGIPDADKFDADMNAWFEEQVFKPTREIGPEIGRIWDETVGSLWDDIWKDGGHADQIDTTVNTWLKDNVGDPVGKAWDDFGKSIPESFKADVDEWGLLPAIANHINNNVAPEIGKAFADGWKNVEEGRWGSSPEGAKNWEGFWKSWNEFWTPDPNLGAEIDKNVNDWWKTNISDPLGKAVDDAWKSISDWWNSDGGADGGRGDNNGEQAWKDFWGGFEGMVGDMGAAGTDLETTVNTWLDENIWKPIGKWFEELDWGKIGQDLMDGFIKGVTGVDPADWEKFSQGFTGWVEDMKKFFGIQSPSTLMFDIAGNIVDGFLNGFGDFATEVGKKWEEIKTTVATKFEEIKAGLATKWEEFKTGWNDFWGGLGTTIGTKWEEFKTTVGTKWEELKSGIAEKWEGFKTSWSDFWGGLGTTIGTKWEEFKTTVGTKWDELKTGMDTKWSEFKTGWDGFWKDTGTNLSTAWTGFTDTVGTKAGEIKTGIETWAGDVGKGWDGFWKDTGTNLTNAWEGFKGTVSDKSGDIKSGVDNFGKDVKTNWDGFWGGVGSTLTTKWNEFTGTTDKKSGEMSGDVNAMAGNVKGDWQNMLNQMSNQITSNFQAFVNVVSQKAGEIVGWVAGLPQRIVDGMGWLGNLLSNAGSSIMTSLYNGLVGSWSLVTDFVGGIANWIAANKGPIAYDRVLLEPAGEAIMGGLDRGIRNGLDPLLTTLQTITAAVTDTVTADLSKSVMYATGRDAAQGLADGLKANRASVHTALGNLGAFTVPSSNIVTGGLSAVGRPTADVIPGRSVTIAEGAIRIETPTKSPELVAAKVIDSFVNYSTF